MYEAGHQIGHYRLLKKLGRGAFGVVWQAERCTSVTKTTVAIKFPIDDEVDLELFHQEAQLWSLASGHPNVLPIIEADVIDGQLLIVSEYAANGSLAEVVGKSGKNIPALREAVRIISDILSGLEHLHSKGIIHRDLKPGNILFQGRAPRLADFGISRIYSSTTHSQGVAGTPVFMAPEAFDGERNEKTDIWSVGVIFYQLLSGSLPFSGNDMGTLLKAIFFTPPFPLSKNIPNSISSIVFRALEKNPDERYSSAADMLNVLQSQAVIVDLLFADQSETGNDSSNTWDGGRTQQLRSKPRSHHYAVVHRVLRDNAFMFPATLVDNLTNSKGANYLKFKWAMHAGAQMSGDMHDTEDVSPDGIECQSILIGEDFKGALIKFPEPVGPTEAFFAAIIIPKNAEPGDICDCRYITLELSPSRVSGTILGEWNFDKYINHGDGPPPTEKDFLTAIERLISEKADNSKSMDEKLANF